MEARPARMTDGAHALFYQIKVSHLPLPETEMRFHPTRRWRFDLAWPDLKLAVEVDGGLYSNGRHTRGKGREGDLQKLGAALELGWTVYVCSTGMVRRGEAIATVRTLITMRSR